MDKAQGTSLEEKLARIVGREWQTAAQIQRLIGGETLEVAKALDRLWEAGRIERETQEIGIGARRRGAQLRRIRFRRRMPKP